MRRIIVVCEGETEMEFCKKILCPHFTTININFQFSLIGKSRGGIVNWDALKKQIEIHLKKDRDAYAATWIDFYGLHGALNFPNWERAKGERDKNEQVSILETAMKNDTSKDLRDRFLPYIQLHEFESLLFCNQDIFSQQIPTQDLVGRLELQNIFAQFSNPELINGDPDNAPSHRLKRIITGYNKIVHGNILAEAIGLDVIREKCSRFNSWLTAIERIAENR